MENQVKPLEEIKLMAKGVESHLKAKKAFRDVMFDLYSNIGLILGFIVFMLTLGVVFGFITYSAVGIRQMVNKIKTCLPKPKVKAKNDNTAETK